MKKNEKVVRIIRIMGHETATVATVESVKKGVIRLVDSDAKYDAEFLSEIDPPISGCSSRLVPFDDGEVERLGL